ncbi:MAG TPA: CGNR zinc finger domain-containing protein [Solirubrobacteraceae bacterium]|jgi:predicted RNA-binding Zn ribbon-like protein|nr:CGNR zinc finger domain-containing protein [Solirubrobacteraceae bacterium]
MAVSNQALDLDAVIDFVNTREPRAGTDELGAPGELRTWLSQRGLLAGSARVSEADRAQAIGLREALRALMLAHNGGPERPAAARALERAARRGGLELHFTEDDTAAAAPSSAGVDGALARLLVPVADAMRSNEWTRVKACRASDCHWAFQDRSRNRSGVWCDMAECGNRTKVRAYRSRTRRG